MSTAETRGPFRRTEPGTYTLNTAALSKEEKPTPRPRLARRRKKEPAKKRLGLKAEK